MTESPAPLPGWHLTADVDDFLARAGDYLRAEPALHTVALSVTGGSSSGSCTGRTAA
jgi:hypothetical protein